MKMFGFSSVCCKKKSQGQIPKKCFSAKINISNAVKDLSEAEVLLSLGAKESYSDNTSSRVQFPHLITIGLTTTEGLNSSFSIDSHTGNS